MKTAISEFPFTLSKDYRVAQAFRNVQGWTDGKFHNYARGTQDYLGTSASVSRWTGVFLNDFSGITASSGKAIVTDLLNFNIDTSCREYWLYDASSRSVQTVKTDWGT
ncbi:hypothetical protein D3C75_486740 [compost metagenome]